MLNSNRKRILFIVLCCMLGLLVAGMSIRLLQRRANLPVDSSVGSVDGIDPAAVVQEVGVLIELPSEQPSIAVVRDVKKLQDQEIFRKAKNGDILLIYVQAKRAYLYDPERKKLVDVAPVNVQDTEPWPSPSN